MDDFNKTTLLSSKDTWISYLLDILTGPIADGVHHMMKEAINVCVTNKEPTKYLSMFQQVLANIPKWNAETILAEKERICEKTNCAYIEDLITAVHIIHLKLLSAMRVGQKQKKININVPNVETFIHKIYINVARTLYKNVYLFEKDISPLQQQKNNNEINTMIKNGIMTTIREGIPIEHILKAYMEESTEEYITEEIIEPPPPPLQQPLPYEPQPLPPPPPLPLPQVTFAEEEPLTPVSLPDLDMDLDLDLDNMAIDLNA